MNTYWLGTMIDTACILMAAAMGDAVCLIAGEMNLGGDGQIYVGAFATALIINACHQFPAMATFFMGIAATILSTIALSAVSVLLKIYRSVPVLLSTYIASAAVTPLIDALISARFRGEGNLLATPFISDAVASPRIMMPSPLSILSLAAPVLCVVVSAAMEKTAIGKNLQLVGASNDFAAYAGLNAHKLSMSSLIFAAAMHGAAGFIMVVGTHHTCIQGFHSGVGWSALTAALVASAIGKTHQSRRSLFSSLAIRVIFSSLLLSSLTTYASSFTLTHFVQFDAASLIQGAAIAIIAVAAARRSR